MTTNDIKNYIEELIQKLGFSVDSIDFNIEDSGSRTIKVTTNNSKELIGRDGETLQALNHIVKRFVEKQGEENHVMLDINDYQDKKIEKIKAITHMMAERARFFKSSVELEPMNAFERHVVHEYIQTTNDLETESTGSGKERRVVIKFKK